jgi:hypothetical protein
MATNRAPAFQFYPGDWKKDVAIQSLDLESKGAVIELLCMMHESPKRGFLMLNGKAMSAKQIGSNLKQNEARCKQILSKIMDAGVFSVDEETGAIYSRRMARQTTLYEVRAAAGRKGGKASKPPPKQKQKRSKTEAKRAPSSSSSSSTSLLSCDFPFEEWWKVYPRRKGANPKKSAHQKWELAAKRVGPEVLFEGVERYRAFCDREGKTGTEYVAMATTWLNGERWNDDLEPSGNGGRPSNAPEPYVPW